MVKTYSDMVKWELELPIFRLESGKMGFHALE